MRKWCKFNFFQSSISKNRTISIGLTLIELVEYATPTLLSFINVHNFAYNFKSIVFWRWLPSANISILIIYEISALIDHWYYRTQIIVSSQGFVGLAARRKSTFSSRVIKAPERALNGIEKCYFDLNLIEEVEYATQTLL